MAIIILYYSETIELKVRSGAPSVSHPFVVGSPWPPFRARCSGLVVVFVLSTQTRGNHYPQ